MDVVVRAVDRQVYFVVDYGQANVLLANALPSPLMVTDCGPQQRILYEVPRDKTCPFYAYCPETTLQLTYLGQVYNLELAAVEGDRHFLTPTIFVSRSYVEHVTKFTFSQLSEQDDTSERVAVKYYLKLERMEIQLVSNFDQTRMELAQLCLSKCAMLLYRT